MKESNDQSMPEKRGKIKEEMLEAEACCKKQFSGLFHVAT
jgi:hypothetical protein